MTSRMQPGTPEFIVGREREQGVLRGALDRAASGQGTFVLVSGDAGIGKTTLVREIAHIASDRGALVLTGHCYDLTTTPPYGPWLEILRTSPRVEGLPSLSRIIDGPAVDDSVADRGDELFTWGLKLFSKLASEQPLVLVLEDVHWADRASLDFLRFLGRTVVELPVLLVATYRVDEVAVGHSLYTLLPAIIRESRPKRIDLHPLDIASTTRWIGDSYALSPADSRRLATYLQHHAEGNPFFAVEMLRELEETGVLRREDAGWSLGELVDIGVPLLLRQVLESRLGRVSRQTREVLSLAAVIGHDVDIQLWRTLARLSEPAIFEVIDEATTAAVVDPSPDGHRLSFRHALIREALYTEILPPRRRSLHFQIAEALLDLDDPDPDAVAHHLQQAGDSRAGEWLIKAGDRAYYRAYSLQTALARYEAALEALPDGAQEERGWLLTQLSQTVRYADPLAGTRFADEAEQIALRLGNRALQAVAIRNRGINRFYSGQNGMDDILRGFGLIEELSPAEREKLRAERQGQRVKPSQARREMAIWHASGGQYREAVEHGERALAVLDPESSSSGVHAAVVYWGAGLAHAMLGNPAVAQRTLEQSQDAFRSTGQQFHAGTAASYELMFVALPYYLDDVAYRERCAEKLLAFGEHELAHVTNDAPDVCIAPLYVLDGRWELLREMQETYAARTRSVYFLFLALPALAEYFRHTGQPSGAWSHVNECFPNGAETEPGDSRFWYAQSMSLQATAANLALDGEDFETARAWIDAHKRWLDWSDSVLGRAENAMLEARISVLTDELANAEANASTAIRLAGNPRQPLALLQARRIHGEVMTALGRDKVARDSLQAAIDLSTACRTPFEQSLIRLALAELAMNTGDERRAQRELADARNVLEPLQARPALDRLQAIRNRLNEACDKIATEMHGLSARELEVLQLAAEGLTDREIGELLFISPRTVGQHMRSIFNKLGVNSRTTAALRGAELGIVRPATT